MASRSAGVDPAARGGNDLTDIAARDFLKKFLEAFVDWSKRFGDQRA